MREIGGPEHVIGPIEFIGKNTFVCVHLMGSDEWKVENGIRQGSTSSGMLFSFYLSKVIPDISKPSVECTLNCS